MKKIKHEREKRFADIYFDHEDWMYEPITFNMGRLRYTPDFYDKRDNVFIEVVGSKQAYHSNKAKYELMKVYHPEITLLVLDEMGRPYPAPKVERKPKSRSYSDSIIGKNIKRLRLKHNFTQQQLIDVIGLKSSGLVSQWESGYCNPSMKTIIKITKIFGIQVSDIFDEQSAA